MKFIDFIKDKLPLIFLNFSILIFVILVIIFSPLNSILFDTIFYITTVNLFFLSFYLIISYIRKNKFLGLLKEGVDNNSFNDVGLIKMNYEEKIYLNLMKNYKSQCENIVNASNDFFNENKDVLNMWIHDIKMPISIIKLIIERNENAYCEKTLDKIDNQVTRIENSVERVLYLSRIDDFHRDFFIHKVYIEEVIKEIIKKYSKYFIENKINLDLVNMHHNILSDKKWLLFILDQIISNALKYTQCGDSISIACVDKDSILKIIIRDTGCGIKKEDLSRIFDKGFTGNNGRNNAKSTGLGLYLVKELCEKLDYKITVHSIYNEYTEFIINFNIGK
ncbi:sensor histidine kinase [Clostridium estertheticum]|uniref:sensor histidine kinase n=1 Tax=Clostridium estertheticum TaxID=238834 RepID=UPI001C0CAC3D|nr:sensor histidine kinase [Clostridium estertheticum]MBU3201144.1 sensor histidine kinase [Clostridium estertheticum]WAG66551.1 sensor histidine kinase [Clostridium estertheticum]